MGSFLSHGVVAAASLVLMLGGAGIDAAAEPTFAAPSCTTANGEHDADSAQDLNNDAHSDLAVGVPKAEVDDATGAGAVDLRYHLDRSNSEAATATDLRITAADLGEVPVAGDHFGASVSTADVDGDLCEDLVIGVPGSHRGAGRVVIVHGSADGVDLGRPTVLDGTVAGDRFGAAVAADGHDVWVGAPGASVDGRVAGAGRVSHFVLNGDRVVHTGDVDENTPGMGGVAEANDHFGAVLALADGHTIVVGEPDEDVGARPDAGTVTVLRFSTRYGLASAATVSQDTAGVGGTAEAHDRFGASVSAYGAGPLVAIGVPGEDLSGVIDAGVAQVIGFGQDRAPAQRFALSQRTPTVSGVPEAGDGFGSSVLLGGLVKDRTNLELDLAIGVPGEDLGTVRDAGLVDVVVVSAARNSEPYPVPGTQARSPLRRGGAGSSNLGGSARTGERAGAGLSALAFTDRRDQSDDVLTTGGEALVVAIPGDDAGGTDAGSLSVYGAAVRGLTGPVAGQRYGVGAGAVPNGPFSNPA